jgi:putative ABC transport system permease protein
MRGAWVQIRENGVMAFDTLRSHKFRSFLTALGIFIGVLIVVGVASVLNGFRQSVVDQVEEFGTNNVYIYRFPFVQMGRLPREVRMRKPLSLEDAWAIRDLCPSAHMVSPGVDVPSFFAKVRYRGEEANSPQVRGVFPESGEVSNAVVDEGRYFTAAENQHRMPVCVIGSTINQALFPAGGGLGKEIVLDGRKFRVVGTLEKRKEGPFGSENPEDKNVEIPYYTALRFYPFLDDHFIAVRSDRGKLDQVIEEVTELLRRRRKVRWNEENNFEVGTADSIIKSFDDIVLATLAVMFLLSTVAFMVGGVGVMNIMLVSVKERTKEIGLRKALGARRRDIAWQFLTEAMALTVLGGALGLLAGEGLLNLLALAVPGLPTATPMWARVVAFCGSGGVGLFFGLWPALKAARLDPIEALRYE